MRGSRKFFQGGGGGGGGGSNCDGFFLVFLVDVEREDPNTTTIKMAFHWCAGGGPTLKAGLVSL